MSTEKDQITRVLAAVLQVAGVATGLLGVFYFVGAATLWFRYSAAGYSPDFAIAHEPETSLVRLGSVLVVGILIATGLSILLAVVLRAVPFKLAKAVGQERAWIRLRRYLRAQMALACAAVILCALFVSWRAVSASLVLIAGIVLERRIRRTRHTRGGFAGMGRPSLRGVLSVVGVATIAAVLWENTGPIQVVGVWTLPPLKASDPNCPTPSLNRVGIPYFGESSEFIYLDRITCWRKAAGSGYVFKPSDRITEYRRSKYRLVFLPHSLRLNVGYPAPYETLGAALHRLFG